MVRQSQKAKVDKSKAQGYKLVAENFYQGAIVADEFEYWNAAGVLIVHSAIAYGDALSIKIAGVKSKGEDHQDLVTLLNNILPETPLKKTSLTQLSRLIDHKNAVSYSGDLYYKKDIVQLWKYLDRFKDWVNTFFD